MSTRSPLYEETLLTLRIYDLLLESAISTLGLIREGLLNPARREMRFLLEASVKAWRFDSAKPTASVSDKLTYLDDIREKFREFVDRTQPRLIDKRPRPHSRTKLQIFMVNFAHLFIRLLA
jgi:hypothetical protein